MTISFDTGGRLGVEARSRMSGVLLVSPVSAAGTRFGSHFVQIEPSGAQCELTVIPEDMALVYLMDPSALPDQNRGEPDDEDVALLRLIDAGSRSAFDRLYRNYYRRLKRFVGQIVYQPQLIEEILNDTMLVVWRKAGTFNQASRVSTWIFAIAYRSALRGVRRSSVPKEAERGDDFDAFKNEPEANVIQSQLRARVRTALNVLSVEQRAVVELTYFHDRSYREIAEIVGCPVDTVKTRMFHARRKLKTALDAQELSDK